MHSWSSVVHVSMYCMYYSVDHIVLHELTKDMWNLLGRYMCYYRILNISVKISTLLLYLNIIYIHHSKSDGVSYQLIDPLYRSICIHFKQDCTRQTSATKDCEMNRDRYKGQTCIVIQQISKYLEQLVFKGRNEKNIVFIVFKYVQQNSQM